jgi:hypothetical protein
VSSRISSASKSVTSSAVTDLLSFLAPALSDGALAKAGGFVLGQIIANAEGRENRNMIGAMFDTYRTVHVAEQFHFDVHITVANNSHVDVILMRYHANTLEMLDRLNDVVESRPDLMETINNCPEFRALSGSDTGALVFPIGVEEFTNGNGGAIHELFNQRLTLDEARQVVGTG